MGFVRTNNKYTLQMSQEVLKNYTLKIINFGNEFLSKLSEIELPAELSEMQVKLAECFIELNRIWNSVDKLAFRFTGDCSMGDLNFKLKQMEINHIEIPQKTLSKSKSIDNLLEAQNLENKKQTSPYLPKRNVSPSPNYTNWSPKVPPKNTKKKVENSISLDFSNNKAGSNKPLVKNDKSYINFPIQASVQGKTEERTPVKSATNSLPRISESFQRAVSENKDNESNEDLEYLALENERPLPEIKSFSLVSKVNDVVVNDWRLGERYCGISEDILYVFYSFQDQYAEISMSIPTVFIGKGFNKEKSVIFQSRDLQVKIYFLNDVNKEKFYKATFHTQNKFNLQHSNPTQSLAKNPAPQMPKPYSKKENGPFYLNTNTWSRTISRHRIATMKKTNNNSLSSVDNGEEEYVDMIPISPKINKVFIN